MNNYLSSYLPAYVGQQSVSVPGIAQFGTDLQKLDGITPPQEFVPSAWQNMLGFKDTNGIQQGGWGMPALGAAKGLFDSWMAMKSYGLAKQQLAEGKRQFGLNFEAQRQTLNTQLEDRQRARVASNPGAYQSVGDYMSKNSIKGG